MHQRVFVVLFPQCHHTQIRQSVCLKKTITTLPASDKTSLECPFRLVKSTTVEIDTSASVIQLCTQRPLRTLALCLPHSLFRFIQMADPILGDSKKKISPHARLRTRIRSQRIV